MNNRLLAIGITVITLLSAATGLSAAVCAVAPDSISITTDGAPMPSTELTDVASDAPVYADRKDNPDFWINRIKARNYNIADTTIIYPRFPGFCVKVYNWADRFFNTYNHDYVMPTGKKWKVMWKSTGWADSYALDMPDNVHMRMLSHMYMSTGPYLSFMAVTVGYGANLNRLITHKPARQKRYDFSFSTSLFEANLYYNRNRGGTSIRRFDPFSQGKLIDIEFPSLQLENYGIAAFYFFNHGRYYQGAAYNYSKIQKRTQGSFIAGFSASHQNIYFDLSSLPEEITLYIPSALRKAYQYDYTDYCVILGYGWNLVFNPHWVFNLTGMPTVGLRSCSEKHSDGKMLLPAVAIAARSGLAYNLRNFFVGGYASVQANWYFNAKTSFVNGIWSMGMCVGLRFNL